MTEALPVIQPPEENMEGRGQLIAFLHMVDEVLDNMLECYQAFGDNREMVRIHNLEQPEFYAFVAGCLMGHERYVDAMLPLASEGVELTASGLLTFDPKQPPNQEEDLFWPDALHLPGAMADGTFALGPILKRDHARDRAVVTAICQGTSPRQPNLKRLVMLSELMLAVAEAVNFEASFFPMLVGGQAIWTTGEHQGAIEILEEMVGDYPDHNVQALVNYFKKELPDGPTWLKTKKWREEAV